MQRKHAETAHFGKHGEKLLILSSILKNMERKLLSFEKHGEETALF
jgi:hypothetical protein